MSEWIGVEERLPPQGVKIMIKTFDRNENIIEIPAIFTIYDIDDNTEAWGWNIGKEDTIARPTHWMPLPERPK